jgi:hypothetical protein
MKSDKASIYSTWPLYVSVGLLILNDHYFKQAYPNWLTGKLSDFAGIFLITLVSCAIFPKQIGKIAIAVILLFAWWKSSYVQPFIDAFNAYAPIDIGRVVDLTDLIALVMIPSAQYVFERIHQFKIKHDLVNLLRIPAIVMTGLAITGTSVMVPHHEYTIRKEIEGQQIDIEKAISIIGNVAEQHDLSCVKCDPTARNGEFKNKEITLKYAIMENNRGIDFSITGDPGGLFFGGDSREDMESIKRYLQNMLGSEIENLEFVIKLPSDNY